jgi:hypothetical protein
MLLEEIETLRGQMQDITAREEALLHGLAASLNDAEQRLLTHVREIAARHSERRVQLIDELRALAAGMGSLTLDARGTEAAAIDVDPPAIAAHQVTFDAVVPMPTGGGHWRDAARMINEDEDVSIAHLLRANAR